MAARIAELEGRLAKGGSVSFKVSEKGAVSVLVWADFQLRCIWNCGLNFFRM